MDSMYLQYCADFHDFVFGVVDECTLVQSKLRKEVIALRTLSELDQFGNIVYAASPQLVSELYAGKTTDEQRAVYASLLDAWKSSGWIDEFPLNRREVAANERKLEKLRLNDVKDRRHLAEAIALNASWFLTNDNDIIEKCQGRKLPMRVSRASECLAEFSRGLFLTTSTPS